MELTTEVTLTVRARIMITMTDGVLQVMKCEVLDCKLVEPAELRRVLIAGICNEQHQ